MSNKLDALIITRTKNLAYLPLEKSAVGLKRIYKNKSCADGLVEQYKARLVAKGFAQ